MRKIRFLVLACIAVVFAVSCANSVLGPDEDGALSKRPMERAVNSQGDHDMVLENIEILPGEMVDIGIRVFVNPSAAGSGETVLAIHGLAHTAASWEPFAKKVFDLKLPAPAGNLVPDFPAGTHPESRLPPRVSRIVAIDLPGRGGSGVPSDGKFGELTLESFVTVILETLERLPRLGLEPTTVIGHSQGALLVQMAQQRLIEAGTTLRAEYGIDTAVMLAASPPADIVWAFSYVALEYFGPFVTWTQELGQHIAVADEVWPHFFFTNAYGELASNAPSAAEVAVYNAKEPTVSASQLIGATVPLPDGTEHTFDRPYVARDAFAAANGTRLHMAAYDQDGQAPPNEGMELYHYLTGDASFAGFSYIEGREAIHDLHISDPETLIRGMAGAF